MRRILLDENLPFGLRKLLPGFIVFHVTELDWDSLSNGRLLDAAEAASFEIFITADQNLRFQQSFAGRRIALLVLSTNRWQRVRPAAPAIAEAASSLRVGDVLALSIQAA